MLFASVGFQSWIDEFYWGCLIQRWLLSKSFRINRVRKVYFIFFIIHFLTCFSSMGCQLSNCVCILQMRTHPVILKAVTVDRIVNRKRDPCAVDSRPVLRRAGVRGDPRPVWNLLLLITVDNRRLHGRVKSLQLLITASVLRILPAADVLRVLPAVDVRLPPGPQHRLNQLRVLLTVFGF